MAIEGRRKKLQELLHTQQGGQQNTAPTPVYFSLHHPLSSILSVTKDWASGVDISLIMIYSGICQSPSGNHLAHFIINI